MGKERTKNSQRNLEEDQQAGLTFLHIKTYQAAVTSTVC